MATTKQKTTGAAKKQEPKPREAGSGKGSYDLGQIEPRPCGKCAGLETRIADLLDDIGALKLKLDAPEEIDAENFRWIGEMVRGMISNVLSQNHVPANIEEAKNIMDVRAAITGISMLARDAMNSAAGSGHNVGFIRGITSRLVVAKLKQTTESLEARLVDLEIAAARRA